MNILINHPSIGSVWLTNTRIVGKFVEGEAWDDTQVGSSYYPDDYMGEWFTMNFPVSCIRKYEKE